jgi:L-seryl-tRNA(Ser) seleniumtransferase
MRERQTPFPFCISSHPLSASPDQPTQSGGAMTGRRVMTERSIPKPAPNSPTRDYRVLPAVDQLLRDTALRDGWSLSDAAASTLFSDVIARARADIATGLDVSRADVVERARSALREVAEPRLSPLINATGIIVHTNLGRAPLSDEASAAMAEAASSYLPLELDPETNQRGGRMAEISRLLRLLTGAEAALVVNNNAAAVLLALSALAAGNRVIVSRGEAVEIGGGFRVPDVLRQSGAELVEVGTTNRTYAADYERAISLDTAALLRVHPSNFRMVGFTTSPSLAALAALGQRHDLPLLEDLGSGALLDTAAVGLEHEPTLEESIAAGVSVVMASGDKLLGGPQAGILLGQQRWIDQIAQHPLARAVRADKTCLAGLAATLRHYLRGDAEQKLPVWRMLYATEKEIEDRARTLCEKLAEVGVDLTVVASEASVGGGSAPGQTLPSCALRFVPQDSQNMDEIARQLRVTTRLPVYGRIVDSGLQFDLRTVLPHEDEDVLETLRTVLTKPPAG